MKRIIGAFIAFLFVSQVFADTVETNGVYYELHDDGTATVVDNPQKYSGDIVIPESFSYLGKEYSVTSIKGGKYTGFYDWQNSGAFYNCSSLTSITLPQSITYIGQAAFDGCIGLQKVFINNLEKWCNIDFDIRTRGPMTGTYEYNLKSNPLYYAHDLYLNDEKIINLTIPESVSEIKSSTFIGGSFKTVSFPSNVSKIYEYAFQHCNSLMDVYCYGKEIDFDNQYAAVFDNHSTKTLHIREKYKDNYIRKIYTEEAERKYEWNKFGTLKYIEGIDVRLRYYVDGELYKDYELEKGDIITPEAYPTKEGYTFDGWSDIPETMPDHDVNVTGTFSPNTYKLTYYVDGELYKVVDVKCDESVETEPYPEKEGNTFSGWNGLPETMPANDVNVYGTFSVNKYKLTFLVDDVEYASYNIDYGSATRVPGNNPKKENYEFVSWSEIPATMPAKNITSTASFKKVSTDIDGIKYKYVGDEAYVIGNNTSGIVKVLSSFEEDGKTYTVTVIDKNAFRSNTNITSVEVPNTIVAINDSAFFGCRNLTNIDLGNSVRTIGERAFANIDKLTDVVCRAEEVPDADRTSFENSYIDYVTLHVPASSVEKYKATGPWKGFKEIVPIEDPTKIVPIHLEDRQIATYNINGINITKANKTAKGLIIRDGKKYYLR